MPGFLFAFDLVRPIERLCGLVLINVWIMAPHQPLGLAINGDPIIPVSFHY